MSGTFASTAPAPARPNSQWSCPLLLFFLFGIIDGARFLWETNRAEKATQMGARTLVVTNVISTGLANQSYLGDTSGGAALTQGDLVSAAALGKIECTSTAGTVGCSCATSPCPWNADPNQHGRLGPDVIAG
jgi:hypothetical protein